MTGKQTLYWALASAALMIIAGFGPWATVLVFSVSGTSGDGWFVVVVAALIAGGLLLWKGAAVRRPPIVASASLLFASVVMAVRARHEAAGSPAANDPGARDG